MTCETITYIYVILVNGNISSDGYFEEAALPEAKRIAKKYESNYTTEVKKIKSYTQQL